MKWRYGLETKLQLITEHMIAFLEGKENNHLKNHQINKEVNRLAS